MSVNFICPSDVNTDCWINNRLIFTVKIAFRIIIVLFKRNGSLFTGCRNEEGAGDVAKFGMAAAPKMASLESAYTFPMVQNTKASTSQQTEKVCLLHLEIFFLPSYESFFYCVILNNLRTFSA